MKQKVFLREKYLLAPGFVSATSALRIMKTRLASNDKTLVNALNDNPSNYCSAIRFVEPLLAI